MPDISLKELLYREITIASEKNANIISDNIKVYKSADEESRKEMYVVTARYYNAVANNVIDSLEKIYPLEIQKLDYLLDNTEECGYTGIEPERGLSAFGLFAILYYAITEETALMEDAEYAIGLQHEIMNSILHQFDVFT